MKRWLFLIHRWFGIFGCLLMVLWFGSGMVMMYVPFPALSDAERLAALPEIQRPGIGPGDAVTRAGNVRVQQLRLLRPTDAAGDSPVYALRLEGRGWLGVDAHSGQILVVDADLARRSAERFSGQPALAVDRVERDQWSVSTVLDPHRPLFAVSMADGGLHYVSSRTGEVVRDTARAERGWNWVGAVVHWVYPTALRSRPTLWHWTVIGLSSHALLTAMLGTAVGMLRWRRYASGKRTPYVGWLRWHHLLGLAGAVFVLAWLLSGLLSMNPGDVFSPRKPSEQQVQAWTGDEWRPALPDQSAGVKEVEWFPDRSGTLAWLRRSAADGQLQLGNQPLAVDDRFVRERALDLGLGEPLAIQRLEAPDLHYHARNAPRPLPVWRVQFADAHQTWVHVDGHCGQPFGRIDASNRAARWLYHGLHSWDFDLLLRHRPLWDILMLAALALGTGLSATSVVIAGHRLRNKFRQMRALRQGGAQPHLKTNRSPT